MMMYVLLFCLIEMNDLKESVVYQKSFKSMFGVASYFKKYNLRVILGDKFLSEQLLIMSINKIGIRLVFVLLFINIQFVYNI